MYSKNWTTNFDTDKENYNMNVMQWNSGPSAKDQAFGCNQNGFRTHQADLGYYTDQKRMNETKVKHSNVEVGFSVTYIEFDNLPVFGQDTDLLKVFEGIKAGFESSDWLQTFNAINNLRSLNKSYPLEVNSIFKAFGANILNAISSPKPCLNKNIIGFIYEVLLQAKSSGIDISVILKFVEILIKKLNTISSWLKSLTESCMNTLLENCLCDQTVVAVCELAVDRNKTISKIAFHYIGAIVSILKERISELQPDTLQALFVTVGVNLESESANNKTLAKNMCQYFHSLMKDNYENYIMFLFNNGCLKTQNVEQFAKAIRTDQPRRTSIANSLSGKKSKVPLKNCRMDFGMGGNRAGF